MDKAATFLKAPHDTLRIMAEVEDEINWEDDGVDEDSEQLTVGETDALVEADTDAAPVSYSGQDFDIIGLVRRLKSDDILIPNFGHQDNRITSAGFQRSFVWRRPQMDRFIESILLGYPIPGIFLVRQADRRYLVLDGQQRLRTLQRFVGGIHEGREFALSNVSKDFKELTYNSLSDEMRRQFDDTFLQATIVSTDGTPGSLEAIYQIFERLNAGGTQLTAHEIRVALYAGTFIDYLVELNETISWRELYGKPSPRLRDQELILRIVALLMNADSYKRPLKTFLNKFVAENRNLRSPVEYDFRERFAQAGNLILGLAGKDSLRPLGKQLNSALTEAVFVGLMRRLNTGPPITAEEVRDVLTRLANDATLQRVTARATANEDSVKLRLDITTKEFS